MDRRSCVGKLVAIVRVLRSGMGSGRLFRAMEGCGSRDQARAPLGAQVLRSLHGSAWAVLHPPARASHVLPAR